MTLHRTTLLLGLTATLALAGTAHAEGLYGTALIGQGFQANDAEAYGNNIAVDPDFPGAFNAGDGMGGVIGLGYDFGSNLRLEGRLGFHNAEFDSTRTGTGARNGEEYTLNGELKSKTLTVEAFYDVPTASAFQPYVKAGLGVARNTYAARLGGAGVAAFDAFDGAQDGYYDAYADTTTTEFTWNVGFGGSYAVNDQLSLVGEYQYVSLGNARTGQDGFTDGFTVDAAAHEILLGVRSSF